MLQTAAMKNTLTPLAPSILFREALNKGNWGMVAIALVLFAVGLGFSHRVEPGIRVEPVTLSGDTPALQFLPAGPAPHPVALLAHGLTASKETLFRFAEALASAGFLCFAVDLPGHGESPRLFSFSLAETVSALEKVARDLGRVDVFVGHSMGAGAGAAAVDDGVLDPQLFIAAGSLPGPFEHGPPLLLLAGRFDECLPRNRLAARTDARLVISSWSDHALEPYDPRLVSAAVEAACAAVGKTPPAAPKCWLWRLAGMVLGIVGALGMATCLPETSPRLTRIRGLLLPILVILACALTGNTWIGVAPHLRRVHLVVAAVGIALLVLIVADRLRVPRWCFPVLAVAVALGCWAASFHLLALLVLGLALVLLAGAFLGHIGACRGSRRDGDVAMAIFVGYAIGQWLPRIL